MNDIVVPAAARQFMAASARTFPSVAVSAPSGGPESTLAIRAIGDKAIVRAHTSALTLETSPARARQLGIDGKVKILWQLAGTARFENADGVVAVAAGEAMVLPLALPYRMELDAGYDALYLAFEPARRAEGAAIWAPLHGRVMGASAALQAAAASVAALMHAHPDPTGAMAVDAVLDLVLRASATGAGGAQAAFDQPAGRLRGAARLIELHLADGAYGPDALAHDLAMSRRSLFASFAQLGTTPAGFIRHIRLQRARAAVLHSRSTKTSLTEIALAHGFADSSTFSRAFKLAFGMAPGVLKNRS